MKHIMEPAFLALVLAFSANSLALAQNAPDNAAQQWGAKQTIQKIKTQDGLNLHLVKNHPQRKAKAVLVISHGLASHSGVFNDFAQRMTDNGIAVYRFDARGHGKSDGRDSIHINSYFEMVEDLRRVVEKAKAENPNLPVFVMGHSMGGHITALYGTKYPKGADGVILAAGVLRYNQMNFGYLPRPEPKGSFINGFEAAHKTLNLPVPDTGAGLSLPNDPLMLEKFSVSFPNSFKEGIQYLKDNDDKFVAPVLLVSGDADLYVVPKDAIQFYEETNSTDKSLRLYNGLGHMLMIGEGGGVVADDIVRWIGDRAK
ncbi:alpha/beta hydrolase [Neisseria yangbaofengii]|uniref:alpha/beta hydrolase n=1 Tax=Neisseria yangbaofengii TaxID=2709396 RepID=UPI0013EC057D|nr:alpha/beta hydrolase [Neisseria yangbaofengii]